MQNFRRTLTHWAQDKNYGLISLVLVLTVSIATLFVCHERYFYVSDWAFYHHMANEVALAFWQSPLKGWQILSKSLHQTYNRLYTLPLLPFLMVFGESRLVYVLSLAVVYLLPLSLMLGAIAKRLIPNHSRAVFWSTVLLTLLLPASWAPTFRGYPDTGGALLMALAALLYIQDSSMKQLRRTVTIGFLLAMAISFRRHFSYDAIAFLGAIVVQHIATLIVNLRGSNPRRLWRDLIVQNAYFGSRIGLIVSTIFITLLILSSSWVRTALTNDYKTLYAGYAQAVDVTVNYYRGFYGWMILAFAGIGFLAGALTKSSNRSGISFVALWGGFCIVEWLFVLRYLGDHYTLNITPKVIIGLAVFSWSIHHWASKKLKVVAATILSLLLFSNAVLGLTPVGNVGSAWRSLFSASHLPMVNANYDETARLVTFLRSVASRKEPIMVASASNLTLSIDAPMSAEEQLYGLKHTMLKLVMPPTVTSSGWYPLHELLRAQFMIVPDRFDQDLVGQQGVVKVLHDAFTDNWEIKQDFRLLPDNFSLGGTATRVYQRVHPTSDATAVRTLYRMQQLIGTRPGGQQDWIELNASPPESGIERVPGNVYKLSLSLSPQADVSRTFVYLGSLGDRAKLTARLQRDASSCLETTVRASLVDKKGIPLEAAETTSQTIQALDLTLRLEAKQPRYLLLKVLGAPTLKPQAEPCKLSLNQLMVSSAQ